MMSLKNILAVLLCGISLCTASATEPISTYFVAMPDILLPTLEENRRKDLLDLFRAKQTAAVTNQLQGTSTLTLLQDSLLTLNLSSQSQLAMRLYQNHKGDTLLALINTVCAPACDSYIRFYTPDWKELSTSQHIRPIDLDEFLQFPDSLDKASRKELQQLVNIRLIEYTFTPEGNLQATPSWEKYLDEESFKRIQPYLRSHITLQWNRGKFK